MEVNKTALITFNDGSSRTLYYDSVTFGDVYIFSLIDFSDAHINMRYVRDIDLFWTPDV